MGASVASVAHVSLLYEIKLNCTMLISLARVAYGPGLKQQISAPVGTGTLVEQASQFDGPRFCNRNGRFKPPDSSASSGQVLRNGIFGK